MRRVWGVVTMLLLHVAFAIAATPADSVSVAGERLRIDDAVRYTTDAVRINSLNEDHKEGRRLLKLAIESDSTYAPARYALGQELLYEDGESALRHARAAYLSDTTNYWYLSGYAKSLIAANQYDEAKPIYRKVIEMKPRDFDGYRVLAMLHNQSKESDEAIAVLDSAEVKAGRNSYMMGLKRQILLSSGKVVRAIAETKQMIDDDPYDAESRVALAEIYGAANRDTLAMKEYRAAMKIDSARVSTLFSYGSYLKRTSREVEYLDVVKKIMGSDEVEMNDKLSLINELMGDKALYGREFLRVGAIITELQITHPNDPDVINLQVKHLISIGMLDEALVVLKRHLDDEPPQLSFHRLVIDIERYRGQLDSVDLYLRRAIDKFPDEESLRSERAVTLTLQGHYDEAVASYKEQMNGANDSLRGTLWAVIGDTYHQKAHSVRDSLGTKAFEREMKRCYKAYDQSMKLYPDNAMVLNNYAYFISEFGGDLDRALEMSERSNELSSSNPTFLDTHGWILYKLGRYDEAKVVLRKAISFDATKNGEIALHYGEVLWVLGEQTMANFYWGQAEKWGMKAEAVAESRARAAKTLEKK